MLWAIPQAPIFLLRKPLRLDPPNLLGLATLTSKRQWGWTQFWGECITQTSHPGKGGCFVPGKVWLPSMHPYLPLQIIALKAANHPSWPHHLPQRETNLWAAQERKAQRFLQEGERG